MASYYVDTNKTIYASTHTFVPTLLFGNAEQTWLGLQDLADLAGQSTVYVNHIKCEWKGTASSGGAGESFGWILAGIVPYDLANSAPSNYSGYQDLKGFPLRDGKKFWYSYTGDTGNSNNRSTASVSWRPKRGRRLLINREQAVAFTLYNDAGQPVTGYMSITLQLKRAG